jgi:alkylation response protein AidB-like acyl-CoA dehydrogenase
MRGGERVERMDFRITDEQTMLRDTVRSFVADKAPLASVREWMVSETGHDPDLWAAIAELGLASMHIPEEYGGAGFSFRELGVVLEEFGRGLTPSPLFASIVLGATAVLLAGSDEQKKAMLPEVAAGETTLTVAVLESGGTWDVDSMETRVAERGGELVISGRKAHVVDGHAADHVVVAAKDDSAALRFVVVPGDAPGLTRRPVSTMDQTRRLAELGLDEVTVPAAAELGAVEAGMLDRLGDIAAVGLAYEQLGGAEAAMEMAVAYAKTRHQFGRPIGSFQAVKHMCADMLVAVESARSAVHAAGWAVDNDEEELAILAPLARTVCSQAYFDVAADNIQVHGGIGFTWEHDAHLYFKRAKSSQLLLGTPGAWRARLADRIGV